MDHGEIFAPDFGHRDFRFAFKWNGERWKKCERKMRDGGAKFAAVGSVPGINRVEGFEHGNIRAVHHAHQIEAGVRNGASAIRKTYQRKRRTLSPHFGVSGARGFEFRERENHVANRAGANEKTPQDYFKP